MSLSSYAELQSSIADWLNRSDLTAQIPDFITLAEAEFTRTLRHRKMITRSDATIDSEYSATPADWMQSQQLIVKTNPVTPLEYVTGEALNQLKATSSAVGRPTHYTNIGTEFQVFPSPDASYTAELVYFRNVPKLSNTNTTNWLLELAPDLYLYGTLLQSAPYLRDDERITTWASLYAKKVLDIEESDQRTRGQTSVRMRFSPLQ